MRTLTTILLILLCANAFGETHYVAASGGTFSTIAEVNAHTFVAGDSILFNRGEVFRGQLTISQSGTSADPIYIGAYGSGVKPIIQGSELLEGWEARGSFYKTKATTDVKDVFANGVRMVSAREPNSGYFPIDTTNGTTTLISDSLTGTTGWEGAEWRGRTQTWAWEHKTVSSWSSPTLTLSGTPAYGLTVDHGFFLNNSFVALDTAKEWYANTTTDSVYLWAAGSVDPTTLTVEGVTSEYVINCDGSNVIITNLDLRYANSAGVYCGSDTNIRITNCDISRMGEYGINAGGAHIVIDSTSITDILGCGITLLGNRDTISNNTLRNCGMSPGRGPEPQDYSGIMLQGSYALVQYNTIDSVGHFGVAFKSYSTIQYNVVRDYMMTTSDGGAYYVFYGSRNLIRYNIAIRGRYSVEGMPAGTGGESHGLYNDENSSYNKWEHNTVAYQWDAGFFVNSKASSGASGNDTLSHNTLYNCATTDVGYFNMNSYWKLETTTGTHDNNVSVGNIFYKFFQSEQPFVANFFISVTTGGEAESPFYFTTMDSNYFVPSAYVSPLSMRAPDTDVPTNYTLAQWTTKYPTLEVNSKYTHATPSASDTIFINTGATDSTVQTGSYWHDLDGAQVGPDILLSPFESRIMTYESSAPGSLPSTPITSAGTNITSSSFSANWSASSGSPTGYYLDVSADNFSTYVSGFQNLDVGNVTTKSVTGLSVGTGYSYRVRAYNGNGTSGNSVTVTTQTSSVVFERKGKAKGRKF